MNLVLILSLAAVAIIQRTSGQGPLGPMHNNVQVCTADTSGPWVRRGIHLRERGECKQGYICDGNEIKPFRAPCRDPSYFSVHTGTCSFPNVYAYIYSSFNCSAEEEDENLDFERLNAKRNDACEQLFSKSDPDLTELYVGDPSDCRQIFKCPNVGVHDDWLHLCPVGTRFGGGSSQDVDGACVPDDQGCGIRQ